MTMRFEFAFLKLESFQNDHFLQNAFKCIDSSAPLILIYKVWTGFWPIPRWRRSGIFLWIFIVIWHGGGNIPIIFAEA